jgi:tetratricopeptide (TPR) repeat protein
MEYILILIAIPFLIIIFILLKSFQLPALIRKAEECIEANDFSKATEIIQKILNKKKDFIPAKYLRATILMKQRQYVMAISELTNILATPDFNKFTSELNIHYQLAFLYNETKNYQREIEEYIAILRFKPDDEKANHRVGHAFYMQKKYKQAKEHLMKALALDPQLKDSYRPLGVSCFKVSDYTNAEHFLTQSLLQTTDPSEAQYYLGLIFQMKKDYENALLMFEKSKNDRKFFTDSLYKIGDIYSDLQNYTNAISYLEQGLVNLKENSEETHAYRYLLAECYEHENKIKEAVYHWEKIFAENPSYKSTRLKLEGYKELLENKSLMNLFSSSIEDLQPFISYIISTIHFNIASKEKISQNEYHYKAYNIKHINEPPLLICFNRTTREITEGQIIEFLRKISEENCKSGIYITTSRFSIRAKATSSSKMIDLYDIEFVNKVIEKSYVFKEKSK